jgi:hypothetical protein
VPDARVGVIHFPFGPRVRRCSSPSPVLQGELVQSNIWKPGPASARERNQSGEVLVERLDSALGHVAEYRCPDSGEGVLTSRRSMRRTRERWPAPEQ